MATLYQRTLTFLGCIKQYNLDYDLRKKLVCVWQTDECLNSIRGVTSSLEFRHKKLITFFNCIKQYNIPLDLRKKIYRTWIANEISNFLKRFAEYYLVLMRISLETMKLEIYKSYAKICEIFSKSSFKYAGNRYIYNALDKTLLKKSFEELV